MVSLSYADGTAQEEGKKTWYGYSKIILSRLAAETRARLSEALGGDILKMRDLVVSTKNIDRLTYSDGVASPIIAASPTVIDVTAFQCDTMEGDENVVSYTGNRVAARIDSSGKKFYYFAPDGTKVEVNASVEDTNTYRGTFKQEFLDGTRPKYVQPFLWTGELPDTTQEFDVDTYERVIDEMVDHGVSGNSEVGVTAGAGVIGDFATDYALSLKASSVVNNYAGNTLNVNNEYSVLDVSKARSSV